MIKNKIFNKETNYLIYFNNGFVNIKCRRKDDNSYYYENGWVRGFLEKKPKVKTIDDILEVFNNVLLKNKEQRNEIF